MKVVQLHEQTPKHFLNPIPIPKIADQGPKESKTTQKLSQINPASATVPPNYVLFGGTVPSSYVLFGGTVPPSYVFFGGTVPPNTFLHF